VHSVPHTSKSLHTDITAPRALRGIVIEPIHVQTPCAQLCDVAPQRPYILWLRLQRAAGDMTDGASVTSAAHRAGFSDSAHLTRTFRRMLGATPSDLALLKRLSLGFSLESSESPNREVRRINGAA